MKRTMIVVVLIVIALIETTWAQSTGPVFTIDQTISDGAQRSTLAFDGLAMMTGNLEAQSFFPPGKVADYTGFQYLRDNDPDNMGHNTSFLTRVAYNVIYLLNDVQFNQLKTLAVAQLDQINLYGYKRFPLMKAFRRLLDGDIPAGSVGLDPVAVKQASRELYLLDGQISFDRALLYANIINSLDSTQRAYLDSMKGNGWNSWPDITSGQIQSKMQGLPQGTAVAVMTYAGDLFSWYAGSLEADVYFCPERQGTYYGGFYIKDAPAIGHEGYSIDEQLTATAGAALCDSSKGYVTTNQAATISSLVGLQRNNLYAGTTNIVSVRTQIATLLRSLLTLPSSSNSVQAQVLALSGTYGDLDGEDNYYYATVFAQVYEVLTSEQKSNLAALRHDILSGTYADGTLFDYTVCPTPFLYSAVITNQSVLMPYIANTDYLFLTPTATPPFDVILGRPTDHSIAVSVLATNNLEAYCEYTTTPGLYTAKTGLTLTGLEADQQYDYRLRYRLVGETNFSATVEHTFHTQRAAGSTFMFAIEADPHYQDNDPAVWQLALANMLADNPDFLIDLGDTFMDEKVGTNTYDGAMSLCRDVRTGFFSILGHSVPLFLVGGNHDPELGWFLDGTTNNLAVWGTTAREFYYPCPAADNFYSGNASRDGYYSFTWGNALFVVLDPFWFTAPKPGKATSGWGWTLGTNQYTWLQQTLSQSTAQFKFVFIHHLVGGSFDGQARGGVEFSKYFEWGGYNTNDTWGFAAQRPGWPMPIQGLLLSNNVTAVFHGHDHIFVRQEFDANGDGSPDLIYQEVPQPSSTNYNNAGTAAGYGYTNGVILSNSGHLRVTVTPTNATVAYVRAFLPADEGNGRTNRMVSYQYTFGTTTSAPFPGTMIPGRPTDSTLSLNVLSSTNLQAYVEYGTQSGVYSSQSAVTNLVAATPAIVEMTGLRANIRCYYRLRFKYAGETNYRADDERTFHTQRSPGSTYIFDIQTDSHIYDKKGDTNLYAITEQNILTDRPDFLLDLGDTFGDDHTPTTSTYAEMQQLHLDQRPFFNITGHVAPLFLCIGNHEGETIGYEYPNTNANPLCTFATQNRLLYYPNPFPNSFYTGNTNSDIYVSTNRVAGLPANYYAWEWGDALFVVLDAYRYLPNAKPTNLWNWTLGKAQYDWFKQTLESSHKPYKFVFAHHVLGQVRGGVTWDGKYEWGGENSNGTWGFAANRPGWAMPIHQLMVTNHVTIFFQGHDHLYAREERDGVIYQEVPIPSDATYHVGDTNATAYTGIVTNNSGHLRVTVAPAGVNVDYVRAFLPADETSGQTNGMVGVTYTVAADTVGDGIPNWWRAQYFGDTGTTTNSSSCAACDFDGDGLTTLQEYSADTNPTNSASRLQITDISLVGADVQLNWIGGSNAWQYVECTQDLATNQWSTIFTNTPPTAIANSILHTGATAATNLYYRIKTRR
jgi:phosphodiesterase/alkaline phosphatase D-like protein